MINSIAEIVLEDVSEMVTKTLDTLEGQISSKQKEVLDIEMTAYLFWTLPTIGAFEGPLQRPVMDALHQAYFEHLKKIGCSHKVVQGVCDEFVKRYKTYDQLLFSKDVEGSNNFLKVGLQFSKFVSEKSGVESGIEILSVPPTLMNLARTKVEGYPKADTN